MGKVTKLKGAKEGKCSDVKGKVSGDTTDMVLFVRTSDEDLKGWNRQRIVDALVFR
jgi:hypothetical protein